MSLFEILAQDVPVHRIAGRFGVEALCLLWPASSGPTGEGIRFLPLAKLANSFDPEKSFRDETPLPISQPVLRDHALLVRPRGEFFSTDRLAVSDMRVNGNDWGIDFSVTHFENLDGEPAPCDLYLVIAINTGDVQLQSLMLQFKGRWHSFQGEETEMAEPAAVPVMIRT
jgi:hypothetical protein